MPAFQTAGPITAIYPGDSIALVNDASTDSGLTTTQQVAITDTGVGATITVINTTNQDATGQMSADPLTTGSYKPASGLIVPSGTALPYNLSQTAIRFTFTVAPTSGSLVVSR